MEYHLPIQPVSLNFSTEPRRNTLLRRKGRAILTLILVPFAVFVAAFMIYERHIDNESEEIIHQLETSNAIEIKLELKRSSRLPMMMDDLNVSAYITTSRSDPQASLQVDGQLSYISGSILYMLIVRNHRGFYIISNVTTGQELSSGCLDPSQIPPLDTIEQSLREGRVIDQVLENHIPCQSGKLIEIFFADEPYVICKYPNSHVAQITGEDINTHLHFLDTNLSTFSQTSDRFGDCPRFNMTNTNINTLSTEVTMIPFLRTRTVRMLTYIYQRASVWAQAFSPKRRLGMFQPHRCGCRSQRRHCIFLHGIGKTKIGPSTDTDSGFGSIHRHAPCCKTTKFVHFDTFANAWYSDNLTSAFCRAAWTLSNDLIQKNDNTSRTLLIRDTIVVGHSMGNLIVAAALSQGKCRLDARTSDWVALQGPMRGSRSANLLLRLCERGNYGNLPRTVLKWLGLCPASPAYRSMRYAPAEAKMKKGHDDDDDDADAAVSDLKRHYQSAMTVYEEQASAVLCGQSPRGILSLDSITLSLAGALSGHQTPHDGVVEMDSCAAPSFSFSRSYHRARFYAPDVNHADGQFQNGDGWFGAHRKPVKWFECLF